MRHLRRELRHMRLLNLGYRDYSHYLRSARWVDKRREYRASGLPQDCFCGETESIQLHHMTYERVGAEELTDLTPVCPPCHAMIHVLVDRGEIGLDFTGFVNKQRAERNAQDAERRAAGQETWVQLHHNELAEQAVAHMKREVKDLRRRALKLGRDPHPIMEKLVKVAQWTNHELANAGY